MTVVRGKKNSKKINNLSFHVECRNPVEDGIFNIQDYEKFLKGHIKISGKRNNLGSVVSVEASEHKVTVNSKAPLSKKYVKYLTKRYLKRTSLRDFLKVVAHADDESSYELKYFNITNDDNDNEESSD